MFGRCKENSKTRAKFSSSHLHGPVPVLGAAIQIVSMPHESEVIVAWYLDLVVGVPGLRLANETFLAMQTG